MSFPRLRRPRSSPATWFFLAPGLLLALPIPPGSGAGAGPAAAGGFPAPASDSLRVRALLDSAAAALGLEAFGQVDRLSLQAEGVSTWTGQGLSPDRPTRIRRLERRTVVDFEGARFYRRSVSRYPDGEPVFCSALLARPDSVFDYDCYSRLLRPRSGTPARTVTTGWRSSRPHGWIEAARARTGEIRRSQGPGGDTRLTFALGGVDRTLVLDARTRLLRRAEWPGRTPLGDSVTRALEYGDYRDLGEWRFPFHLVYRNPGGSEQELRYTRVDVDPAVADSLFRPPTGARRAEADADEEAGPRVRPLGGGAYEVREIAPDHNTMFVETGEGVAVFDAPGDARTAERTLRLVEQELPDSRVRWVVLTHFHHDHVSGLRPFVERGAVVLTTGGNAAFVDELLSTHREEAAGGKAGADPSIEVVRDRRELGAGPGRTVLHAVDARPHVDELLIPRLPEAGIVYVADLVWRRSGGPVRPADRETDAFREILDEQGWKPRRLVLAHGEALAPEELAEAYGLEPGLR